MPVVANIWFPLNYHRAMNRAYDIINDIQIDSITVGNTVFKLVFSFTVLEGFYHATIYKDSEMREELKRFTLDRKTLDIEGCIKQAVDYFNEIVAAELSK